MKLEIVEPHAEMITPKYNPDWAEQAILLIEECGRVSHKSEGRIKSGSAIPFIRKIAMKYGHESIIEHVNFTACLIGSRSFSHQLVRHRIAAFTQESQRYCDYSVIKEQNPEENEGRRLKIIVPPSYGYLPAGTIVYFNHSGTLEVKEPSLSPHSNVTGKLAGFLYHRLLDYKGYLGDIADGILAEDAREGLPNATKTEVYTTFNLRQWRHVFKMRLDKHAQWQITKCIGGVYNYFKEVCPLLLENLKTHSGEEFIDATRNEQ